MPKNIWGKISNHFKYLTADDFDDTDFGFGGKYKGWVTRQRQAVAIEISGKYNTKTKKWEW